MCPRCGLFAILVVIGAGCVQLISADHYRRTCNSDDDCFAIYEGDPCHECGTNAAINALDADAYQADLSRAQERCVSPPPICEGGRPAVCLGNRCEIFPGPGE